MTDRSQAIVDGEPPDLPAERFSTSARDFVRGALNKIPKLRPTYAMLLSHPWLSGLSKPATIVEEDEEDVVAADKDAGAAEQPSVPGSVDQEISRWVSAALARRSLSGKRVPSKAPALHAAPLSSG